jgi:hypothetical protein
MKSSVKNTLIAAAVATVLGSGAAHALAPSANYAYTFVASGGSAQENAAFVAARNLLSPGSIDVYTTNTSGGADGTYLIVTGTLNSTATASLAAGNAIFVYRFGGGSFPNGVQPFYTGTSTPNVTVPSVAAITGATATGAGTLGNAVPATPTYKITSTATSAVAPDFGLADVEATLFNGTPDNLNGVTPLTASQITSLQQDGIYLDVFGVAVTNALYNAAHPKTNFTKQEVQGILGGQVKNWNQLFADDGTQLPSVPVFLLDRGSGSGSKAAGNQYFLNNPGSKDAGGALDPGSVTSAGVNAGYTNTALNLSGGYQDVKEGSNAAIVSDLQAANAAGKYAVAILAAEFAPAYNQVGGANQYSFAKIGGVGIDTGTTGDNINGTTATKYTNVITGAYDFAYQNSFNSRAGFVGGATNNGKWAALVRTQLQSESLSGANSGLAFPAAVTGLLIDPANAPAQDAGVVLWSRLKNSTAPTQLNFDATTVNPAGAGGTQAITFGSEPL